MMHDIVKPLVSIGLPVFNGEKHLEKALISFLCQDYLNLEIVISDNCSNDSTKNICNKFILKDKRIKYSRNLENIGPARNFQRVLDLSTGVYFMWAAHDDIREPSFITKCVDRLEDESTAVLCHTYTNVFIEGKKDLLFTATLDSFEDKKNIFERYRETLCNFPMIAFYGLYRRSAINNKNNFGTFLANDVAFILRLSLRGPFVQVPEVLFNYYGRDKWNTVNEDYKHLTGKDFKPWWYIPFAILFFHNIKNILNSNENLFVKSVLFYFLIDHQVITLSRRFLTVFCGIACPRKCFERFGLKVYERLWHSKNIKVGNRDLFLQRVIKPTIRWRE